MDTKFITDAFPVVLVLDEKIYILSSGNMRKYGVK